MCDSELNFYNGGELKYTINKTQNDDVIDLPIISLANCDVRNNEFTVRIELVENGKRISIDAPINLKHIKNWVSKVEKQDKEIKYNHERVIQNIKEKFRLDNVLSDPEIYELEKEYDSALNKYDITRKEFERKYCGGFEEWHRCGIYDRWGKHDQNSYIELYEKVGTLGHKACILKCKYENESKKRAVKYGWYDVDEDTIDWY
jgi:hypothetical protein